MAYFAPYIDSTGLNYPTYEDIRDYLVEQAKTIFGSDTYLEPDSMDYQYISIFALKMFDTLQTAELVYNSRGPSTAIGSGLDVIVKLNGLARKSPSRSTCQVTLTGTAGTIVSNGIVSDVNGNKWDISSPVTIGAGGTVTATATAQVVGPVQAAPGTVTGIATPTAGWVSVTNAAAAIPGQAVETDSQLRARQAVSASLPSHTLLAGTIAAIAALADVTRYKICENYTGATDGNGIPAHSISCVVEGDTDDNVAAAISRNKSDGCGTYGTTSVSVTDVYDITRTISFYRPSYIDVDVSLTVKKLGGYTTATGAAIKTAIARYLNSLAIGEDITHSALYAVALSVTDLTAPSFSITALTICVHGGSPGTTDITIAFNEVSRGTEAYISLTETT